MLKACVKWNVVHVERQYSDQIDLCIKINHAKLYLFAKYYLQSKIQNDCLYWCKKNWESV